MSVSARLRRRIENDFPSSSREVERLLAAVQSGSRDHDRVLAAVASVLAANDLPLAERQVVRRDDSGVIGRADFLYRPERLVIEADSCRHHTALSDWRTDRARDARLAALGLRVIGVTWHDLVERSDAFAATVLRALRASSAA